MAIADIDSVEPVIVKLQTLLERAQRFKQTNDIESSLPAETFEDAPSPIVRGTDNIVLTRGIIERAARTIFYNIVANTSIDEPSFSRIWNLLDILQFYEDRGQTPPALVLWLLEELLDSQNIDGCRRVFDYMESRREVLIANNFAKNKDLVILRCCNELLHRLSRAEDAAFCGRVFIFLFLSFPLGDKSSVNPRGEFHVENVTIFEETPVDGSGDGEPMSLDADVANSGEEPAQAQSTVEDGVLNEKRLDGSTKVANQESVDTNTFYPIFWTLQRTFSDPTRLFADKYFESFKKGLAATLAEFKEVPTVMSAKSESKQNLSRQESEGHDDFANTFNPKYLTSRDLFKLELSDLSFQRHILVQALILVDFLLSLTQKSKDKLALLNPNKALRYAYTLSEENAEWTLGIKKTIASYLQDGPDGKFYYRMIDTVLSRDKNWVRWKLENCPEIKRTPLSPQTFQEARSGAKRACTTRRLKAAPMGALELGFLSESDGSSLMDALKNPERFEMPSTDLYVKGIANIELDMDFAATEDEKTSLEEAKGSKTWRALRIASRSKLGKFDKIEDGKSLEVLLEPDINLTMDEVAGSTTTIAAAAATVASNPDEEPHQEDVEAAAAVANATKAEVPEAQGVDSVAEQDGV